MKTLLLLAVTAVAAQDAEKKEPMYGDEWIQCKSGNRFTAVMDGTDKLKFSAFLNHKSWMAIAFAKMGNMKQDMIWVRVNERNKNDPEIKDMRVGDEKRPSNEDDGNRRNADRKDFNKNLNDKQQSVDFTRKLDTGDKDDDALLGCDKSDVAEDKAMNGKWVEADWFGKQGTWDAVDYEQMGNWFYKFDKKDDKCMFMISASGASQVLASVAAISSAYVIATL